MSDNLDSLRRVPIFAMLDDDALERISEISTEFVAPRGQVLIERGHGGTGVFIIEEGSVTVDLPNETSITLGPGEFVGELSVLADTPRTARVSVASDLRSLAIRRDDLDDLLVSQPSIALAMLRVVARKLADATTS